MKELNGSQLIDYIQPLIYFFKMKAAYKINRSVTLVRELIVICALFLAIVGIVVHSKSKVKVEIQLSEHTHLKLFKEETPAVNEVMPEKVEDKIP